MNLFDANIQSSFNNFIGKQAPPPVPSFGSTQAPQTTNSTQPIGTPAKRISTGFVPGYEGTVDTSQNFFNRMMTPVETGIRSFSQNIEQGGQQLSDMAMQHAQSANDRGYNQGYIDLGQKIKAKHPQYADLSDEELGRKIVAKYPQYQDIVDAGSGIMSNPISGSLASVESGISKGFGTMFQGISNIGSASLQEDAGSASLRYIKGVGGTGFGAAQLATSVMPTAMGAKALITPTVNTLFSTDTAGKVLKPVNTGLDILGGTLQESVGLDSQSSASKDAREILAMVGNIALLRGAQKGASKAYDVASPYVKPLVQGGVDLAKKIPNPLPKVKEMFSESISGVPKSEQVGMQSNPYQMEEFNNMVTRAKSGEGIDAIKNYQTEQYGKVTDQVTKKLDEMQAQKSEDSSVYQDIKSLPTQVPVQPIIANIHSILDKNGLGIVDGNVFRLKGTAGGTITDSDVAHINRIYQDLLGDANRQGGNIDVTQTLKARMTASRYARYDKMDVNTLSSDGSNIMKGIRQAIDTQAKATVPGLKELDAHFVDQLEKVHDGLRDLVYKGGDMKGDYRSNIGSIVSNLANPSRANLLARLEEVIPGIGSKIEAINNLSRLHKAMNEKGILRKYSGIEGATTGAIIGGTVLPFAGHILGGITGAITGMFIDGAITKAKVSILESILSKETPAKQAEISRIIEGVKKGQALDAQGKKIVEDIKQKVIDAKVADIVNPKEKNKLLQSSTGKSTGAKVFKKNPTTPDVIILPEKLSTGISENAKMGTTKPKPPAQKLLPAPRVPEGTTLPRTDLSAESMRGVSNSKRPQSNALEIKPLVTPQKSISKKLEQVPLVKKEDKPLKPLTIKKESATMGGMENTKLIKPVEAILKKGSDDELSSIIKSQKDSRFIVKKPFIINKNTYRGVTDEKYIGKGMATYGDGLYVTTNKKMAQEYAGKNGKVLEIDKKQLPDNPIQFKTVMDYQNWLDYDIKKKLGIKSLEFNTRYPDIGKFIKSLGFDGVSINNGEIIVSYKN